jgi:LPS sulfotransferase NodH
VSGPASDIIARTRAHPPVDTSFIAGRWHRSSLSLQGFWTEAKVLGSSLITPANRDIKTFLIIGRARSGTTLLTRLLNAHPDVRCGGEVISRRVLAPAQYLGRLARKSPTAAYGAKLLSFQMVQVQRLRDPVGFLSRLDRNGFRFIHLRRDTFAQTLSLNMAQSSKVFHLKDERPGKQASTAPATIDIDDFLRRLEWSEMLLDYELHCLKDFPHLTITYEEDLEKQDRHQATADRVFDWIGVPSAPVTGGMRKVLASDPSKVIANYDSLVQRMRAGGFAHLLPA